MEPPLALEIVLAVVACAAGVAFRPLPLVTTPCAFKGVHSGGASAHVVGKLTKGPSSQQSAAPPQLAILRAWSPGFPHPIAGTLCAKARYAR